MRRSLILLALLLITTCSIAGTISGTIRDNKGSPLPYASISVKGTNRGTTSNSSGRYSLSLSPGEYTLVAQYVGYSKTEKSITVTDASATLDFDLSIQELTLGEVIVKKGEDPAYEIIRQAIKKRDYYNDQVDSFTVMVYIKGLLRSGTMPKKLFGQKIERDDSDGLDSLGKGILYLSESLTQVDYSKPDKIKYKVISSRESGGGYGFSFPFFINFYQNNVTVFGNNLNPRGFISPIADGALNYYRFRYEGFFMEDGKMVNTIRVTPRRKNEPLFSGVIQIVEDDWRIYSTDLYATKGQQLEMLDSIRVIQMHAPVSTNVWKTKSQVLQLELRQFGFHITGSFVNVYSDYNINPGFEKKHFGRTIMKYDTAFNKKDTSYWNAVRPVALENDEKRNFIFRDSISRVWRDSSLSKRRLDSLRSSREPLTVKGILWSGESNYFYSKRSVTNWQLKPLIRQLEYNTVEGWVVKLDQSFRYTRRKSRYNFLLDWNTRYGFSNSHLNSWGELTIDPRARSYRNRYLKISGGKRVSQFNHDNPVSPLMNSLYTILWEKNFLKIYENWFGRLEYNNRLESGLLFNVSTTFENRIPLMNTTNWSLYNKERQFTSNHPVELTDIPFNRHQALVAAARISYQPGQRYIEFPDYKMALPSKAPVFTLEYAKGIKNLLGSDVDFDKWKFSMADNINFKIAGEFRYRVGAGGFLNNNRVEIPDQQHFNGNQMFYNFKYLHSFQLAPYYRYSNSENFFVYGHAEHHFNGLLTNKIPLFNRLKWYLVGGANTFYVNQDNYYVEVFAGVENIFKVFRVDFVTAIQPGESNNFGVRVGLGGLLGGKISFGQ
ncbi:MAG: DUF5686 and carboxypeptidase regulatory-like domain-containing protein [Chitinophagaceae bacterium]